MLKSHLGVVVEAGRVAVWQRAQEQLEGGGCLFVGWGEGGNVLKCQVVCVCGGV